MTKSRRAGLRELRDCLFLLTLVGVSVSLYTGGLGFYGDDWAFLRLLETTNDQSYPGLLQALHGGDLVLQQRPVQVAYLAAVYAAFGLDPLGYHIVNAAVIAAVVVLLYLVLRELEQPTGVAVAVAAVYAVMPNYSTDRFWIAAHQATLSVLFLLVSVLAALGGLRGGTLRATALIGLSTTALVVSGLAYEVTIPLFALVIVFFAYRARRGGLREGQRVHGRVVALLGANVIALAAVVAFKAERSVRVGVTQTYGDYLADLVGGTLRVDLGVYGVGLPYVLAWIVGHAADVGVLSVGIVIAGGVAAYLFRADGAPDRNLRSMGARYLASGLVVMGAGYAIFLVPTVLSFSSASLGNRIRIAAALGAAAVLVGAVVLVASLIRTQRGRDAFVAVAVGLLCGAGFVITNTLARYWVSAWSAQRELTARLQADVPTLAPRSTVILDGVCLERGGAYIFTGHRDVTGVLAIRYGNSGLKGSAITKLPSITEDGVFVHTFGTPDFFRYGETLIVYNAATRRHHRLVNRSRTERYFRRSGFRPEEDCLPGFGWRGEAPPTGS